VEKPALNPIFRNNSKMAISLREVTGSPQGDYLPSLNSQAIDKNCGEIDKKYWTQDREDFTLEIDRQREMPHG
jgi:hypothetical protein